MERKLLKKMLAIGLSAAMAFTVVPFVTAGNTQIEAEAAANDTVTVTYVVQVKKDKTAFENTFNTLNKARSTANASATDLDLKWNSDLETYAINRAEDIALFNNNDQTRPNGKSDMTLRTESATGSENDPSPTNLPDISAFVIYTGDSNSTPDSTWASNTNVLSASTKSAAIGHVSYGGKEFYCLVLSTDDKKGESDFSKVQLDYSNTGFTTQPQVTRQLAYKNIGTIYARYTYNGISDYDPVKFTEGNGISTAQFPQTVTTTIDQSASLPQITYAVSPVGADSADSVYDLDQTIPTTVKYDNTKMSVESDRVTGKSAGSSTITYEANVVGKLTDFNIPVTVNKANLSNATMTVDTSTTYYANGTESKPKVTVSMPGATGNLVEGTDYTLTYADNKPATSVTTEQTATVTATGIGNYEGSIQRTFKIQPTTGGRLSEATITVTEKNIVYDGKEKKPKATVSLHGVTVPESSYTLKYSNNVKAGTANITAAAKSGDERYSGVAKGTFTIAQADISTADFTFADSDNKSNTSPQYSYTGGDIKPEPGVKVDSLTLTKNTDFTYSYSNNRAMGTQAAVTVTGKGNFTGTASANFEITQGDITKATVTATPSSTFTFNGQRQYPTMVVVAISGHQLAQGVDYDITAFPNSVNAGTYTYTITGKNNFQGTGTTTTTSTTSGTTSASTGTTSTTGTTTADNAIVSTDKAAGTITAQYTIQAKNAEELYNKTNGITVTGVPKSVTYTGKAQTPEISVVDNALGKILSSDTDYTRTDSDNTNPGTASISLAFKGNYSGTLTLNYKITPKKTSISKVKAGKKKATVTYKKVSGISGYQVKAGTNKAVTKGTKTKNTTKTKYTMKSLKSKKRYYFRVRTYFTGSDGKKVYSSWSGVKSVKVK
ncbi:MAG: CAP domain-containing protein [Lachnospiraceae bacterium]|nr:CAP domain-containing protein [Lachnospiraceae bacterium]